MNLETAFGIIKVQFLERSNLDHFSKILYYDIPQISSINLVLKSLIYFFLKNPSWPKIFPWRPNVTFHIDRDYIFHFKCLFITINSRIQLFSWLIRMQLLKKSWFQLIQILFWNKTILSYFSIIYKFLFSLNEDDKLGNLHFFSYAYYGVLKTFTLKFLII